MSDAKTQVNSAILIMGPTGSGKTSLLATLAMYVWETYHKVSLYYSCDGGGFPTLMQALIDRGIVRLWRMRTRGDSFETCFRASQGWWPQRIDPRTGESEPGGKLLPPITQQFTMFCEQGHQLLQVPFQSMLLPTFCAQCRTQITLATARVTRTMYRTKGFEQVGAVMYDGLTSMSSWWQHDLQQKQGTRELEGEKSAIGGIVTSGDMRFGGGNRAQVGFAQTRAEEVAGNVLGIPGLVVPPVFTALTLETSDEGGLPIRGPKLSGRAKTDEGPSWFGDCLETGVAKNDEGLDVYRLNIQEYVDSSGIRHLCKNRAAPNTMPACLEDAPGHAFEHFNLGVFLRLRQAALEKTGAEVSQRYPDAPGLPSGIVEYGEAVTAPVVAQAPTPTPGTLGEAPTKPAAPTVRPGRVRSKPAVVAAPMPAAQPVADPAPPPAPEPSPVVTPQPLEPPAPVAETVPQPEAPVQPSGPVATPQPAPLPPPRPAMAAPPGMRPPVAPRRPTPPRPAPVPVGAGKS